MSPDAAPIKDDFQNQENQGFLPPQFPLMNLNPMVPLYPMAPFGMMPGFNYPFGVPCYNPYFHQGAMMPPPPLFQGFQEPQKVKKPEEPQEPQNPCMPQQKPQESIEHQELLEPKKPQGSESLLTPQHESLLKAVLEHIPNPNIQEIDDLAKQMGVDPSVVSSFFLSQKHERPEESDVEIIEDQGSEEDNLQRDRFNNRELLRGLQPHNDLEEMQEPDQSDRIQEPQEPSECEEPQEPDSVEIIEEPEEPAQVAEVPQEPDSVQDDPPQPLRQEQKLSVIQGSLTLHKPETPSQYTFKSYISNEITNLPLKDNNNIVLTNNLGRRIIAEIGARRISQATFADKVCGRNQGTISLLLKMPKPWKYIHSGKETYWKMLDWLELCEKDKMAVIEGRDTECCKFDPPKQSYKRRTTEDLSPEVKKPKTVITEEQRKLLNASYEQNVFPTKETIEELAEQVGLTANTVKNYFVGQRKRRGSRIQ